MRDLGVDPDRVNVNGGAIALGHPIGMSGARIALHLIYELRRRGGGLGAAALCGGGGQGDALLLRVPAPTSAEQHVTGAAARPTAGADPEALVAAARAGDPRALARLVSLVENELARAAPGHEACIAPHGRARPRSSG